MFFHVKENTLNEEKLNIDNYANPVKQYDDFYEMFNDMPNQMKTAIRKEKVNENSKYL